jgi:ubiquitin fusion degradation protein 1
MSATMLKTVERVSFATSKFCFVILCSVYNQLFFPFLVIMPPSALDQLTRLNIEYPMLFKITNKNGDRTTHTGVLEFIADEGKVYIPFWMMRNLLLQEGDLVTIENVSLPVATFSKFQPQSVDFLDITNPKAVLENCLRNFACLTTGDLVAINYNNKIYELCVLETKPGRAVTIIECDMNVSRVAFKTLSNRMTWFLILGGV